MASIKQAGPKRKRLTFEQQQKAAALEELLFPVGAGDVDEFGREGEQDAELQAVTELVRQAQAKQQRDDGGDGEGDHEFLIWEDRGAGPVAADCEDSEEELAGPAQTLLADRAAPEGSSSEAAGSSSEDDRGAASEESEDEDAEGDEKGAGEALDLDRSADEAEPAGRGVLLWEDRQGGPAAQQVVPAAQRRPAWEDEEDEAVEVNIAGRNRLRKLRQTEEETIVTGREYEARLRQQHSKLNPRTSWAAAQLEGRAKRKRGFGDDLSEDDEEEREGVLASAGPLLARGALLPAGLLEATRVRDANIAEPSAAVVHSVEFHPDGQVLMTAGLDKRLRFFQVDGVRNPKIQSIYLDNFAITQAAFAAGGSHVIATARRKHFYAFDLASASIEKVAGLVGRPEKSLERFAACPAPDNPLVAFLGNEGCVPLLSLRSRQCVGDLKMSGTVRTAAFSADGLELLTSGSDGVVHTWDMRMRRCLSRAVDEGCFCSTSLAASPDGRLYATGSKAGVVNIYNRSLGQQGSTLGSGHPMLPASVSPLKTLMNLTTSVDSMAFNPDTQIFAMASRMKKDALRLVHLPSCTVFSNWPTSRSPLGYVHSLAFSPGGGYLAVGNAKGRALLYRLHHYTAS